MLRSCHAIGVPRREELRPGWRAMPPSALRTGPGSRPRVGETVDPSAGANGVTIGVEGTDPAAGSAGTIAVGAAEDGGTERARRSEGDRGVTTSRSAVARPIT